ncbi:unnamed protein product [Toxocara canis]|uniref:Peroxiredoxin n=1 Tax=Toxocara canis TaxID=6265 RepID=A0A183U6L8_TOXCA|nr:unnamed protein product [Toxocara canis]
MGVNMPEGCHCGDISVTLSENAEAALVLLFGFGWAGCSDRYLAKYSQIYENAGKVTLVGKRAKKYC